MRPFINWANSREKDLGAILPLIPKDIDTFVDPFVGDGACYLAVEARNYALADRNQELINAYRAVQTGGPRLRSLLPELARIWNGCDTTFEGIRSGLLELKHSVDSGLFSDYLSLTKAVGRITDKVSFEELFPTPFTEPFEFQTELRHQMILALESMGEETEDESAALSFYTAFKAAVFQYFAEVFNKPESKNTLRAALLVFLMEYARADKYVEDAGQFRPEYAGRKANQRSISDRIDTILSPTLGQKMEVTRTYCQDIFRTLGFPFSKEAGNFMFLDIPSVSPKTLSKAGRKRLAEYLQSGTKVRWMLICPMEDMILGYLPDRETG